MPSRDVNRMRFALREPAARATIRRLRRFDVLESQKARQGRCVVRVALVSGGSHGAA